MAVGKKLMSGFGAVLCILMVLVAFIEYKLIDQDTLQTRIIELRFPTKVAGHDLINGINYSLAALRGYMILGKDVFKQQRQEAWHDIQINIDIMTEMSKSWTVPKNIETLKELKVVLAEFKTAQKHVEDISHSPDEQPAMKILLRDAAPRASKVMKAITAIINEEKELEATPARKSLLATFADSRGSFAMGLASIRAYLISGDQKWSDEFNKRWSVNTERFKTIEQNSYLLSETQQKNFKIYTDMRNEFAPFPAEMFVIRGSNKWNMANYLLGKEAAPLAGKALKILSEMAINQSQLVASDAQTLQQESTNLKVISLIATAIALIIGGLIAWIITRMIVTPLTEAMAVSKCIAEGDLSSTIRINSTDETGQLLQRMKQMQDKLTQVIESDVQNIVNSARKGDLSQRIEMDDKKGCYETLCTGINELVDVSDNVVSDTVRVFGALAKGDLNETITQDYQGSFNQLKQDANATIEKIKQVIEGDIQAIVDAALAGDLSRRIELSGKEGFFRELSTGINELLGTLSQVFGEIADVMGTLAKGDMSLGMEGDYSGMFSDVKNDINETRNNLADIVLKLRDSADQINTSSEEITAGNTSLSNRTEQQASALEETASSMEELTSTVRNNADNAQLANQVAVTAKQTAERGGEVVGNAVQAMSEINTASNKIAEIITVIDEIAFQTNLLALNASVEAARAGEQGRGFAVVATEVRNLAGRSATSAKEIKDLIQDSVEKVKIGADLVNESGETLGEIVEGVKKVGDIISEIAAASKEQSSGIDQVNQAVTSMDELTQQNAALAEETSAASASMTEQARDMNNLMDFFNLSEGNSNNESRIAVRSVSTPAKVSAKRPAATPITRKVKPATTQAKVSDDSDEWGEF